MLARLNLGAFTDSALQKYDCSTIVLQRNLERRLNNQVASKFLSVSKLCQ